MLHKLNHKWNYFQCNLDEAAIQGESNCFIGAVPKSSEDIDFRPFQIYS